MLWILFTVWLNKKKKKKCSKNNFYGRPFRGGVDLLPAIFTVSLCQVDKYYLIFQRKVRRYFAWPWQTSSSELAYSQLMITGSSWTTSSGQVQKCFSLLLVKHLDWFYFPHYRTPRLLVSAVYILHLMIVFSLALWQVISRHLLPWGRWCCLTVKVCTCENLHFYSLPLPALWSSEHSDQQTFPSSVSVGINFVPCSQKVISSAQPLWHQWWCCFLTKWQSLWSSQTLQNTVYLQSQLLYFQSNWFQMLEVLCPQEIQQRSFKPIFTTSLVQSSFLGKETKMELAIWDVQASRKALNPQCTRTAKFHFCSPFTFIHK